MQPLNLIAVGLAFLFLVPGFIIHSVISSVTPRRHDETQLLALRFLAFSAINAFICAPLLVHIKNSYPTHLYTWGNWGRASVVLLLAPVAIGVLISLIEESRLLPLLFRRIGLSLMHQSPSAWDTRFKFLARGNHGFMIVTLAGGRTVYGYFGDVSIASTDANERDLYLQRIYSPDASGNWTPVPNSGGIIIKGSTIESIEVIKEVNPCQTTRPRNWVSRTLLAEKLSSLLRTRMGTPFSRGAARLTGGEQAGITRRRAVRLSWPRRQR